MPTLCFSFGIIFYFSFISLGHLGLRLRGFLRFISIGFPCANDIRALNAHPPKINSIDIKNI